jgi:hypothetical protein
MRRSITYLKRHKEVTPDYIKGSASERKASIAAWYALLVHIIPIDFIRRCDAYQQYIEQLSPNELTARKRAMRE